MFLLYYYLMIGKKKICSCSQRRVAFKALCSYIVCSYIKNVYYH